VGNGAPIDSGSSSIKRTATKKIPYYEDKKVKAGVSYQYGIVNKSYKSGNFDVIEISDIVWQDVGDKSYVKALAKSTTPTFVENPTAPTVTVTPFTTNSYYAGLIPPGLAHNPDYLVVEIKGLTYGYTYTFSTDYSSDATNSSTPNWHNSSSYILKGDKNGYSSFISPSFDDNAFIEQKLGEEAPVSVGYIITSGTHSTNASDPKEAVRIKVTYAGDKLNQLKVSHYDANTAAVIKSGIEQSDTEVLEQYIF
jgi:hypothetical protein